MSPSVGSKRQCLCLCQLVNHWNLDVTNDPVKDIFLYSSDWYLLKNVINYEPLKNTRIPNVTGGGGQEPHTSLM